MKSCTASGDIFACGLSSETTDKELTSSSSTTTKNDIKKVQVFILKGSWLQTTTICRLSRR